MHPSDQEGKRESDWVQTINGTPVMVNYMTYAHAQMLQMYDIAQSAESQNPETGLRIKWQARLCDNGRLPTRAKPPSRLPSNDIVVNGVKLPPPAAVVAEPSKRSAAAAGVPQWTTTVAAATIQDRIEGSTQLAVLEEFNCQHTTQSWMDSISTWVEKEDIAELVVLPLARWMGTTLYAGQAQRAKREIIALMTKSVADGRLPEGFRLMQAIQTFSMYYHMTPGDWDLEQVRRTHGWAKLSKGDIVLDSSTEVNCINQVYPK